jgi:8-oxo-dGTP pyrophosphatase MutT (NUDIX family)
MRDHLHLTPVVGRGPIGVTGGEDVEHAPAEVVAPSMFAAIRDDRGRLLLVRRVDNGNWELPGGQVEVGNSAVGALRREVAEEAGVAIDVLGVSGVYSDPAYVIRSFAGQVRQPFAVCFHATPTPGTAHPQPDHAETSEASWTDPAELDSLRVHPQCGAGSTTPSPAPTQGITGSSNSLLPAPGAPPACHGLRWRGSEPGWNSLISHSASQ